MPTDYKDVIRAKGKKVKENDYHPHNINNSKEINDRLENNKSRSKNKQIFADSM